MKITECIWDTEFFGFKIGEYKTSELTLQLLNTIIINAQCENYKLIYIKSHNNNPQLDNILFCDERRIYHKKRKRNNYIPYYPISKYNKTTISESLFELALESGKYSRFHLDPNFPDECFEKLYKKWIENSLNKTIASDILTYNEQETPIGLLTYNNKNNKSTIGLISVSKKKQKKGIGKRLIHYYENSLNNSIEILEVVTQGVNKSACSFYEKNGYILSSTSYIYHLWI